MSADHRALTATEPSQLWQAALEFLRLRVSREGFETWLTPTRARALHEDTVEVEVPNSFFADWLSQHYAADVRAALATVAGTDLKVAFRPRDAVQGRIRPAFGSTARPPTGGGQTRLQPRYSFETFVVGDSNSLAHAAARSVAENPGSSYSPMFIYGGVGLGKTHLLQAIGNHRLAARNGAKVYYAAAETVFIELIQAIERNTRIEFKNKYRALDILLLDDVHYLVGKERLQEEIFHIFNHLHDSGAQVVFTSDRPPRDIPTLEERLVSRLGSGLVVDIQPPDIETRMAILRRRAAVERIDLPEDVCYHIASRIKTNVRALEGSLVRLLAITSLQAHPLTVELAEAAMDGLVAPERPLDAGRILEQVATHYGMTATALCSEKRTKQLALARQTAMYLMRSILNLSLKEIGQHCGNRDHTTVMHALDKLDQLKALDRAYADVLRALTAKITGGNGG